jgi:hypothetical protein
MNPCSERNRLRQSLNVQRSITDELREVAT